MSQDRGALWNPVEVDLIANLCRDLLRILHVESIGIITPYRKQKSEIQSRLVEEGLSRGANTIEVNTVDGFQGREKDVIILSCVRAQTYRGSIGFLSDKQRMNVALTRARHALYVFGHMETLKGGSTDWKAVVEDAEKRCCFFPVEYPTEVRSVLSIGLTSGIQSPATDPRLKTQHILSQVSDSHGNSFSSNDRDENQMDTPREVSCSGSAVELHEGQVAPASRVETKQSVTVEGRVNTAVAEIAGETSTSVKTNVNGSEPLPSNGQRDDHAIESKRKMVNCTHSDKHEQGKHDKEGTKYRDRHQKETSEVQRHRQRSPDRRNDHRRDRNRDSRKRDHRHRHPHRQDHRNEATGDSNYTQHSRHHSSHRDRDGDHYRDRDATRHHRDHNRDRDRGHRHRDRDRNRSHCDRDRIEGDEYQGRQMESGESRKRPDTWARYPSATTTTTSLDKNVVSNAEEINSNHTLEINTEDPLLSSLIENNGTHPPEYYVKLRQQEQLAKSGTSPAETGWSPAQTEWSPAESEWSPAENEWSPPETTGSPTETAITRVQNPLVSARGQTAVIRASNPGVYTRAETAVARTPNLAVSTRVGTAVTRAPNPGVPSRVEPVATKTPNLAVSTRVGTAVTKTPSPEVSSTVEPVVTKTPNLAVSTRVGTAVTRAPNPPPARVSQPTSSTYSSAAPSPSISNAVHRTFETSASSSSLLSPPITSRSFTSLGGNHLLDRRKSSELDPSAQRAADLIRQRRPPVQGPQIIQPTSDPGKWKLNGGSRKRKAHADIGDVSSLRGRATREVNSPPKRAAVDPTRRNSLKKKKMKMQETYRGRTSWK